MGGCKPVTMPMLPELCLSKDMPPNTPQDIAFMTNTPLAHTSLKWVLALFHGHQNYYPWLPYPPLKPNTSQLWRQEKCMLDAQSCGGDGLPTDNSLCAQN